MSQLLLARIVGTVSVHLLRVKIKKMSKMQNHLYTLILLLAVEGRPLFSDFVSSGNRLTMNGLVREQIKTDTDTPTKD